MKVEINIGLISKILGIIIALGTIVWALSGKFNTFEIMITRLEVKVDMILEERKAERDRELLYKRYNETKTIPSTRNE